MLKKVKKIINILTWPAILIISQVFIAFISFSITSLFLKDSKSFWFNEIYILFSIILNILIFIIPIYLNKLKNEEQNKLSLKQIVKILIISIIFSLMINLIFKTNNHQSFSFTFMISTCFIGPILEELIYRKIVLEKIRKNKYLITTLIFAISHFNVYKIFTSFMAGSLFYYFLNKYKSLYASIVSHIVYNLVCYLFIIV